MLVPLERSSAVLVMISSKNVSICNRSRARSVDSSRNDSFLGDTQIGILFFCVLVCLMSLVIVVVRTSASDCLEDRL